MSHRLIEVRRGRRSRIALVAAYAAVGILWILFSDRLVAALVPHPYQEAVSTTKGVAFVVTTAVLAWLLLLARDLRLEREQDALERSEQRYRMLAERSQDVVYRFLLHPAPRFEYVSPAVTALTGYTPEEHYADPTLGRDMMSDGDREALWLTANGAGEGPILVRWRRRDGETMWTEHRVTAVRDEHGNPVAVEGAARDVTARILADGQHRLLTGAIDAAPVAVAVLSGPADGFRLTYVNAALASLTGIPAADLAGRGAIELFATGRPELRAEVENRLATGPFELPAMLPTPGREPTPVSVLVAPVTDVAGRIESVIAFITDRSEAVARDLAEAQLNRVLDASPAAIVVIDEFATVTAWNPAAERIFGRPATETVGHALDLLPEDERARFLAQQGRLTDGEPLPPQEIDLLRRDGSRVPCRVQVGLIEGPPARPTGMVLVIEDLTAQRAQERAQVELVSAIDAAGEAILITDLDGTITYVNPACERVTGYARSELIGRNPRILKSGLTSPAVYEDLWRRLTGGRVWRGMLVNRRRDGTLYEEEAVFSPVMGPGGAPVAFVAVKRDLTLERHLAAGLSSELNDRAAVQEAIATVDLGETAEETAQLLCDSLAAFPDMESVMVVHLPVGGDSAVVIGQVGILGSDRELGDALEAGIAAHIREQAEAGPWTVDHGSGRVDHRISREELAGMAVVGAPIRHRGRVVGAVLGATSTRFADSWAVRYLRIISELAAHVGPLLGPALARRDITSTSTEALRRVIDERAFRPHFQPVCELETRLPVGWESLTRFDDGVPPLHRFGDAHALGLGDDLEVACGEAAVEAFVAMARDGWLSVNVSPGLVLAGRAEAIVRSMRGPLVLELTGHVPVDDYPRLRSAINRLGAPAMIAIDDTGPGRATFRHVLELRPDFVKLDLSLIHEIDRDTGRQAMIAGMVTYAADTGARLIAEGIETEAERRALLRLGVRYGQGNLLGVPSLDGAVSAALGSPAT